MPHPLDISGPRSDAVTARARASGTAREKRRCPGFEVTASTCRFAASSAIAYVPFPAIQNRASTRSACAWASARSRAASSAAAAPLEQLRAAASRVHRVPLHLDERDGRGRRRPVRERDPVVAVLPALVAEPLRRAARVLEEAVAVEVGVTVDPGERRLRGGQERVHRRGVAGPALVLREEDDEERRRVRRAVVGRVRHLARRRHLPEPHLVRDLPGLGVARRVVLARLEPREEAERVARDVGGGEERLEAGEERVAPERAGVPGDARRHDGLAEVVDGERLQIGDAAARGRRRRSRARSGSGWRGRPTPRTRRASSARARRTAARSAAAAAAPRRGRAGARPCRARSRRRRGRRPRPAPPARGGGRRARPGR